MTVAKIPGASASLTALPAPRAFLFDWDNTLAHNWTAIATAMNAALSAFGLPPWSMEQARDNSRFALSDSFPRLFGERWHEARDIFYRVFAANQLQSLGAMAGAEAVTAHLAARNAWVGVVSNKRGQYLREEVRILGWDSRFKAVVGADDAEAPKPSPAPVRLALKLGRAPIEAGPAIWFIGDSETDIATARNAGCTPILVSAPPVPDNAHLAAAAFDNLTVFLAALQDILS